MGLSMGVSSGERVFSFDVPLGDGYEDVELELRPLCEHSFMFIVQYPVPFKLNVEPDGKSATPVVTKDGTEGEMVGDILRATSAWSQGMNAAGLTSDIMQFAGNVKWRKSIFDTTGAPWQATVDALLSNTAERSSVVSLVFERPISADQAAAMMEGEEL